VELLGEAVVGKLASATAGLSFAYLREVTQAAGLAAIRAGRETRTENDLTEAAAMNEAHRAAGFGFPPSSDEPFGLAQFRASHAAGEGDSQDER
jgi:hypothetical protein